MNRFHDPGANQNNTLATLAALAALIAIPSQPAKLLPFAKWSLASCQQNQTKNILSKNPIITLSQLEISRMPSPGCLSSKQTMLVWFQKMLYLNPCYFLR